MLDNWFDRHIEGQTFGSIFILKVKDLELDKVYLSVTQLYILFPSFFLQPRIASIYAWRHTNLIDLLTLL